jgi:hypothetical protein
MSLATRRRRERNRRVLLGAAKWLFVLGLLGALGYSAHEAGTRLARLDVDRLERRVLELEQQRAALEAQVGQLRNELAESRAATQQLQQRYNAEVPRGPLASLTALLRERLGAGLDAERLRIALQSAERLRRCDGPVVSRRFRIGMGARATDEDSTSFAEGLIRVSALAPAGAEDITRSVVVTFSGLGSGGPRSVTGLPATHTIVLDNHEMRLTVSDSGIRGFATASLTTCRLG